MQEGTGIMLSPSTWHQVVMKGMHAQNKAASKILACMVYKKRYCRAMACIFFLGGGGGGGGGGEGSML